MMPFLFRRFAAYLLVVSLLVVFAAPAEAADQDQAERVEQALRLDSRIGAMDLNVFQRGPKYVIIGSVPSLLGKDLAEETVKSLVGENYTVNGLKVSPPQIPDAEIRNAISVSIPSHCLMEIENFKVDVHDGMVTLYGVGKSLHHRWMADYLSRGTKGVKAVVNKISVAGERKSDHWIRENVLALLRSHFQEYEINNLSVSVMDGRVTVGGITNEYTTKKHVDEIVRNVTGVVSITNKILLRSRTSAKYRW